MSSMDELKAAIVASINEKVGNQRMAIWDGMLDKLLELFTGLLDSCVGQLSPAKQAAILCNPNELQRSRMRRAVRREIYGNSSRRYEEQGGQYAADALFDGAKVLGEAKCAKAIVEMTTGDNYWPNADLFMG